ncbi:hypothetical protein ES332_A05G325700v1 [Gossypium tomentosum]|uniref:Uncharacterized protein n=1 Tax=Gossypium tomentosum TaxID=34277 RepID=A0A5D2QN84_GOSTO|nr:hypothetical protein ES332_A05G325700v1 [Gossypium tomentosum]
MILGFHLVSKSFSRDIVQEVLRLINNIFQLIDPATDIWVGKLLIFSIIQHRFHRFQDYLQFLQPSSVKFLSFDKPHNIPRNNLIKQHINGSREKSFTHHCHVYLLGFLVKKGLKEDEKETNSKNGKEGCFN